MFAYLLVGTGFGSGSIIGEFFSQNYKLQITRQSQLDQRLLWSRDNYKDDNDNYENDDNDGDDDNENDGGNENDDGHDHPTSRDR